MNILVEAVALAHRAKQLGLPDGKELLNAAEAVKRANEDENIAELSFATSVLKAEIEDSYFRIKEVLEKEQTK